MGELASPTSVEVGGQRMTYESEGSRSAIREELSRRECVCLRRATFRLSLRQVARREKGNGGADTILERNDARRRRSVSQRRAAGADDWPRAAPAKSHD